MAKSFKNVEILWASVRENLIIIYKPNNWVVILLLFHQIIEKIEKFGKSFNELNKRNSKSLFN